MNRSPNTLAQFTFSLSMKLRHLRHEPFLPTRAFASAASKIVLPLSRKLGRGHLVTAKVYGRSLIVPAEHALPPTLAEFPQYNLPLALSARAVADFRRNEKPLAIIDVGANVGDTIAIIEQRCPAISRYLCIEADPNLAYLCRLNYKQNDCVTVVQQFIGEKEGTAVFLEDDGNANPSTKVAGSSDQTSGDDRLVRLDTVATPFAMQLDQVSLIKVDTEGYDFSILRSGQQLLKRFKPSIYFEWFPRLLQGLGEDASDGFEYLASLGYEYFVFFTNRGDYHCTLHHPERFVLDSLAALTCNADSLVYFDVFTSPSRETCERLVELSQRIGRCETEGGWER